MLDRSPGPRAQWQRGTRRCQPKQRPWGPGAQRRGAHTLQARSASLRRRARLHKPAADSLQARHTAPGNSWLPCALGRRLRTPSPLSARRRALRGNGVTGGGVRTHKGITAGALKVPGGLIYQQRTVLLSIGATACGGLTSHAWTFKHGLKLVGTYAALVRPHVQGGAARRRRARGDK